MAEITQEQRDRAIEIIEHSRDTHLQWYNHLGQCTQCIEDGTEKKVGDRKHHADCIANYDIVLDVLRRG